VLIILFIHSVFWCILFDVNKYLPFSALTLLVGWPNIHFVKLEWLQKLVC